MLSSLSHQTMPERTVGPKLTINIGNQLQKNGNLKSQRILSDAISTLIGTQFLNTSVCIPGTESGYRE